MDTTTEQPDTSRYHVHNLERALKIFEYLADTPVGGTLTDTANALQFPKNSVFRIMSTLLAHGYLVRDEHSQRFTLNGKLLGLACRGTGADQFVEIAGDIMRGLRNDSGETALMGRLIDHGGVVLAQAVSRQPIKVAVDPGTRFLLHTAVPAKSIMAFLPVDERDELVDTITFTRLTDRTITGKAAFRKELEAVRTRGYAVDWGEEVDGINCVGAPIFDHSRMPIASIWVSGPDTRLAHDRFGEFGKLVIAAARQVSERLGYTGGSPEGSASTMYC